MTSGEFVPMGHPIDRAPSVSRMYGESGEQGDLLIIIICDHCRITMFKYI